MKPKRTLVIGDIHGALKALQQVLERANFQIANDQLIFLGDYIDGYSEGAELVEFLIQLQKQCKYTPVFIRGNHDDLVERWLVAGEKPSTWVHRNGGLSTIDSYTKTGYLTKKSHQVFFEDLLNYYIDEKNRAFVHGGFLSKQGLGHEEYAEDYYWDRTLFSNVINDQMDEEDKQLSQQTPSVLEIKEMDSSYDESIFLNSRKRKPNEAHKEVYIGHTPTINWKLNTQKKYEKTKIRKLGITTPINIQNIWNVDTAAGYGIKLTMMDIETKEYFQSDLLGTLYPDEKSR